MQSAKAVRDEQKTPVKKTENEKDAVCAQQRRVIGLPADMQTTAFSAFRAEGGTSRNS